MKKSKTFRLSEEACAILDAQENATLYIEEKIISGTPIERDPPWKNLEYRLDNIEKKLAALSVADAPSTPPQTWYSTGDPIEPEYPLCCTTQEKCKHWSYEGTTGTWTNSITGETKETI